MLTTIADHLSTLDRYPDLHCRDLRRHLADYCGVSLDQIVCGNGAADVIHRVILARRPRKVLVCAPTFSEYERSARTIDAAVVHHRLAPPTFDLTETILDQITDDIDLVFLCQPNNPTGRLIDPTLLWRVINQTERCGATVAIDECFLPFTNAPSTLHCPDKSAESVMLPPHVVLIRAFTKTHGLAGLRLGYAVTGDPLFARRMSEQPPRWNVSSLAQAAGVAALDVPGWEHRTREVVRAEREFMTTSLTDLGLDVIESQANFLLVRSATNLYDALLEHGILIRRCAGFLGLDDTYFRIGLHQHRDNTVVIAALTEILHPSTPTV